ncbi:MAG: alpha-galactosidase [Eubacteriaceae bacterium]|nr:alpha-galactosidase [Eubacteriaceae bacterium]
MELTEKTVKTSLPVEETVRDDENRFSLKLKASRECVIDTVRVSFAFSFEPKADALFANGFQSWTYCPERRVGVSDNALKYCPQFLEDKHGFSRYSDVFVTGRPKKGTYRGYSYAYVRREDIFFLFASTAEDTGFTQITLDPASGKIIFEKGCRGRHLKEDEEYTALDLYFAVGGEDDVFDGWFAAMGIVPMPAKEKMGYTSWYNCYQDISDRSVLRDLEGMKALERLPDIFQIDDGYEEHVGDWLRVDQRKFPDGLEPVIDRIRDEGYTPGLWISPFVCEKYSLLFREHPDWLLLDAGEPVFAGGNWSGTYALDFYNGELRDYIVSCIDHYKAMGISLFKLDFLYGACMMPRENRTRGEIMAEAMDFLRQACGEAEILACGVPLASAFGRVEYCRIGPDMTLSYDGELKMKPFHNERPSTKRTQRNTVYRRQLERRAFLNDPDVFLLREDNTTLSWQQKLTLAKINALFGSVLFASDDFSTYSDEQNRAFSLLCELNHAKDMKVKVRSLSEKKHCLTISYRIDDEQRIEDYVL